MFLSKVVEGFSSNHCNSAVLRLSLCFLLYSDFLYLDSFLGPRLRPTFLLAQWNRKVVPVVHVILIYRAGPGKCSSLWDSIRHCRKGGFLGPVPRNGVSRGRCTYVLAMSTGEQDVVTNKV